MREPNLRQEKFVNEYIKSGNAVEAAIKAGYSKSYAEGLSTKLLNKKVIQKLYEEKKKQLESEAIAGQQEVLAYLTSVLRGESSSSQLVVLGTGDGRSKPELVNKPPEEKDRLRAAELLGKRYGLFTEKQEHTGDISVNVKVDYGN